MNSPDAPSDHPLRGPETLLVIDDDGRIRLLIEQLLRRHGYRILCAADGREGLELFQQHRVDLVLLDLSMPGLPGEQVLEQLIAQAPDTKVIMITGFTTEEESLSAARAILYKPFALEDLVQQVRTVLDS